MYGPPPSPLQQTILLPIAEHPALYGACIALGLGISALYLIARLPWAVRALAFCTGQVIALTSPYALVLHRHVIGDYPTIDKAGSLLFYLDGVHQRLTLHPIESLTDPAARLIGVHVGHLWITAAFDMVLQPFAAFNAQGLLWVILGWWAASLFARELSGRDFSALLVGLPFGMGLHVFRDLNWYTIEKAAVAMLALFAWGALRASRRGGVHVPIAALLYVLMAWINWYLALVGALGAALALGIAWAGRSEDRWRLLATCVASALAAAPLVLLQYALLQGDGTLGDPDAFLYERAMLDSFTLVPPLWNRLEIWRALNLPLIALAIVGAVRGQRLDRGLAVLASALWLLALGPQLLPGLWNPVYMGLRELIPGFWRIAKPEVFFEGTYLLLLGLAARALPRELPRWSYAVFALGWLLVVRTHPVYPGLSAFVEQDLDPNWADKAFEAPDAP